MEGRVVRVRGSRYLVVERARDKVGTNWWCRPIRKGHVTQEGWRAFRERDMEIVR